MAREILFRGKHICNGEWIKGSLIVYPQGQCEIHHFGEYPFEYKQTDVRPETVGQFTGLTDKNGKRIFEGDIIKILPTVTFDPNCEWETCFVHFYRGSFVCSPIRFLGKDKIPGWQLRNLIENYKLVIGNIHDNPELLNGTEP